jgi:hypothetical protein
MPNTNKHNANTTTSTPAHIPPVWLRVPEAVRVSGLCRSSIYNLITNGKVKSFTNKVQPDCQRGTRLISYASLMAYLENAYTESTGAGV